MSARLNSWVGRFGDAAPLAMLRLADQAIGRRVLETVEVDELLVAAAAGGTRPSPRRFRAGLVALLERKGFSVRRRYFRRRARFEEARSPFSDGITLALVPLPTLASSVVTASVSGGVEIAPSVIAKKPRKKRGSANPNPKE